MIPEDRLSTETVQGEFIFPSGLYATRTQDYELGGVALQDPSQGLQVQAWFCYLEDESIYIRPVESTSPTLLMTRAGVVELSVAFDQNMRWNLALLLDTGELEFHWYDTVVNEYVTSVYPNVVSVKATLDDKRPLQILQDTSDVILTYIRSNASLYYRQQRDRYETEYLLIEDCPVNYRISNFGMTTKQRLQWRFQVK